jgi:hypothetical protein
MFQTLPNYIPKKTIDFVCALHETVKKEIQFTNPSNKSVIYQVKLIDSGFFKVEDDQIKIEPR